MKKQGFTLAEVLITLGIIGVIAALTMPLFIQKTQTAKIGPKLGKAIVTFENAMKAIMIRAESDTLTGSYICTTGGNVNSCADTNKAYLVPQSGQTLGTAFNQTAFMTNINDFVSGSVDSNNVLTDANGVTYKFGKIDNNGAFTPGAPNLKSCSNIEASKCQLSDALQIDINGTAEPNMAAKDRFYFYIMEDGTLRPFGSSASATNLQWSYDNNCKEGEVPSENGAIFCAGHVVEHNMKVEYK